MTSLRVGSRARQRVGAASFVLTLILTVCALALTILALRREFGGGDEPLPPGSRFVAQPDWASYATLGHRLGSADAKAVIVEFADFQCPACRELEATLRHARRRFGEDLAIVYRHFPLARIHPFAYGAAQASECAALQGRFDAMHDLLFDHSDALGRVPWRQLAEAAGVENMRAFERCIADSTTRSVIESDHEAARSLGARGTPTVLINGVRFTGSIPERVLDSLVTAAIGRKGGNVRWWRRLIGKANTGA
jgi:predicted DsbA family dithiol-disulfide isomerase